GTLVQLGWNAGPRHARVWGLAKSYTKSYDQPTREAKDHDAVAALSLFWRFLEACMPQELIDPVSSELKAAGMPKLATRDIEAGAGWQFRLNNKFYRFSLAERAPPEGYMGQGYTA
ncbi:hypothetical protein DENSPDRAFT_770300, partial [Dentipellis sp. KUC8613]